MNARPLVATAAALTLTLAAGTGSHAAKADPEVTTLAKNLVSPLSVAVDGDGTRYFSQNFAGLLMRQAPGGQPEVIFKAPKRAEVGAVSVSAGVVTFAVSEGNNEKGTIYRASEAGVVKIGKIHPVEKKENPDGATRYGFRNLAASCAKKVKGFPVSSRGIKETHPYATTTIGDTTYVADAGANAIFKVDADGVSPVAVIPPARAVITKDVAKTQGLPACTVGKAYYFESVPTDIEVGPGGKLYVTSLPGGPEDGSLGPLASVFSVKPGSGKVKKVVGGLVSATGLAVAANGDLYVAELFRGRIARIKAGSTKVRTFLEVPLPSDVELGPDGLYAAIKSLPGKKPKGTLIRIAS
jgi:hypothetical protein